MPKIFLNKITLFIVLPIVAIIVSISVLSPNTIPNLLSKASNVRGASTLTNQELLSAGLYDVTSFGADPTGQRDSTAAIQQAIDTALKQAKTEDPQRGAVFFPTGTYLITDSLRGLQDRQQSRTNTVALIGSTKGERPKIVLRENSFNDNNNANNLSIAGKKAMLHIWTCETNKEQFGEGERFVCVPVYNDQKANLNKTDGGVPMNMANMIRNLEFVVKSGNPDAIAIRFAGAQNNVISNVKITAEGDSFVGLYSTIGTDSVVQDLEIVGGRIGIHGGSSEFPSFSNVRLINQSDFAISGLKSAGPLSLNGFYIEKNTTPVISDEAIDFAYAGHSNSGGAYALSDGIIKIRNASQNMAIDNGTRQLTLQNVYFENTPVIAKSRGANVTGAANGWTRVNVYAKVMENFGGPITVRDGNESITFTSSNEGVRYANGTLTTTDLVNIETNNVVAPNVARIVGQHSVPRNLLPSPDVIMEKSKAGDPAYVNINDKGILPVRGNITEASPDQRAALQQIIDTPGVKYVLIPRGIYLLKDTLEIKGNVVVVGVTSALSELRSHPSISGSGQKYLVRTENSTTAAPTLAFFKIETHPLPNMPLGSLHIRSGKSLVYAVMARSLYAAKGDINTFVPRNKFYLSDSAGGRFYGLGTGGAGINSQWYAGFRGIKVLGTTQPITFYGANPEDGGYTCEDGATKPTQCRPNPVSQQIEVRNAKNVAFRGFKCEDYHSVMMYNTQNVFVNGAGGCLDWVYENVDQALVLNLASKFNDNVARAGHTGKLNREGGKSMFEEKFGGRTTVDTKMKHSLAAMQRGAMPDFSVWNNGIVTPPQCGNGVVEGNETCDLGSSNGACPSTCSATCTTNTCEQPPVCGNGIKETGEACDAGSANGACPSTCSLTCSTNTCEDPPTGERIVLNGGFKLPAVDPKEIAKYWHFGKGKLGDSSARIVNAKNTNLAKGPAVRIDITTNPPTGMPTLFQSDIDIDPNTTYSVSFVARASSAGTAQLMFRDMGIIKTALAPTVRFDITEGWKMYSSTVRTTNFNPNKAGFFTLGFKLPNGSNVVVDNVVVTPYVPGEELDLTQSSPEE